MKYQLLSVDLQNDFATDGGKHYKVRPSINFDKKVLFPFLVKNNIKISEIISDYRQLRPGDKDESCIPGSWGYESIVPKKIVKDTWIKCMNSPIWIRKNIGNPAKKPGLPYQDTKAFGKWLDKNIGKQAEVTPVLFGLTLDCCVLSTLQELNWRGYYPLVLDNGVDHYRGTKEDKKNILKSAVTNWAKVVYWDNLKNKLK